MRGSITKKGNKYFIVVDLERDHNNKRRQKWFSGYSTKKAAEKDLPRILNELYQGTYVEPSNETVETYMISWLKNKKSKIHLSTHEVYQTHIRLHIKPYLGRQRLDKLNRLHLKRFYTHLEDNKQLAPSREAIAMFSEKLYRDYQN